MTGRMATSSKQQATQKKETGDNYRNITHLSVPRKISNRILLLETMKDKVDGRLSDRQAGIRLFLTHRHMSTLWTSKKPSTACTQRDPGSPSGDQGTTGMPSLNISVSTSHRLGDETDNGGEEERHSVDSLDTAGQPGPTVTHRAADARQGTAALAFFTAQVGLNINSKKTYALKIITVIEEPVMLNPTTLEGVPLISLNHC